MPLDESGTCRAGAGGRAFGEGIPDRYDPSAAAGVPAHITLLYPFRSPGEIDQAMLDDLRGCFHAFASFRFSLAPIRRFPHGVVYLAPDPDEPFRQLVQAVWDRYPETPPYGGKWPDIVPHLSVAWVKDEQRCDRIADDFTHAARGKLPIAATAAEVTLMAKRSGHWRMHATFALR